MAAGGVAALRRLPLAATRSITCRIPSETIADTHRGRPARARIESQQIRSAGYPAPIGRQGALWLRRADTLICYIGGRRPAGGRRGGGSTDRVGRLPPAGDLWCCRKRRDTAAACRPAKRIN